MCEKGCWKVEMAMDEKQADDILAEVLGEIDTEVTEFVSELIVRTHRSERLEERIGMDLDIFMDHAKQAAVEAVNENVC